MLIFRILLLSGLFRPRKITYNKINMTVNMYSMSTYVNFEFHIIILNFKRTADFF
jgi:hypothetical protein